MFRDESACNTYNYGDAVYWDARYVNEASFDWYQRYHALRPFVRKYIPLDSRVLMVGCGNAARPGFQRPDGSSSSPNSYMSPVPTTEKGLLPPDYVLEDPDSHFIYICTKRSENSDLGDSPAISMTVDI
ncbi:hypothetical protein CTI12_AA304380 [Artemisia annua]|uniref:S-adenosyl-L-methionine-dependent methyltransferases superfamily protein n=1 Tax=Artemisia annua TaxID=35608 RepID=A0A2U1N5H9_ARTAN|nr:hypothetical protein CTI12_AA304380 [Artemisia annua]